MKPLTKLAQNSAAWLVVLISITLVSVVWLGFATLRNTDKFQASEHELAQKLGEVRLIESTVAAYLDAESGLRGFFLTDEQSLLDEFKSALEHTEVLLQKLRNDYKPPTENAEIYRQFDQVLDDRLGILQGAGKLSHHGNLARDTPQVDFLKQAGAAKLRVREHAARLVAKLDDDLSHLRSASRERAEWTKLEIVWGHILASGLLAIAGATIYIDRRKRSLVEQDLVATSQRLAGIIASASSAIISIDAQQRIVLMNSTAEKMFGCTLERAQGRDIGEFFPTESRQRHRELFNAFAKSTDSQNRVINELLGLRENGAEFPAAMSISKSGSGDQRLVTLLIRDLSEQYASQAKMREQAAILNQIRDAVQIRDIEDQITYWNQGTELVYGWSADEAVGKYPSDLMAPQCLPEHAAATESLMRYGSWIGEIMQLTKDGREILVEQRRTLLHDASGKASGQLIICLDVSERQRQELNERRRQRLESLGTLAGGIAHDLNNVLTPITMASTMLELEQPAATREKLAKTIRASAERGAEMIRQLLAFAGGGKQIERQTVCIVDIVEEVRGLLAHTLPKSIRLSIEVSPNINPICGDATELTQVLINLAVNARDAMPQGGELSISAQNRWLAKSTTIGATLLPAGRYLELNVSDTGEGVPSQIAENVFDPFFTTKEQGKGTGLGLATCLGIVHSHGGSLSLTSQEGQGATFTILLPAEEHVVRDSERSKIPIPINPRGHGELILVVDDEDLIAAMARDTLESHGYRVMIASNGVEAVEVCVSHSPEVAVILMDMMMPVMDGPTAIRKLRSTGIQTPVIASSGLRSSAQTTAEGAAAFLPKPFSEQQLLQTLYETLQSTHASISRLGDSR
ncbi:MAG: PAS domain S-box protein [Pirellulaceae bacterium]|nr:PAS domain S-box protein [Pirellulaceae bacterium]